MKEVHYESYMDNPQIAAICLNCTRNDCDGICDDFRDAYRQTIGLPKKRTRGCGIKGPDGNGIWRDIEAFGQRHTLAEWSAITGINYCTLHRRVTVYGWTIEQALMSKTCKKNEPAVIEVNGKRMTAREWAAELGIGYSTIYKYFKLYGSKEAAITAISERKEAL